jgi:hypothetical protein
LIEIFIVSKIGELRKQDPLAYFYVTPTVFDADDVAAMSLSAHYALLRALDQSGIDTSDLRIKEKFTGGRRGEDI